MPVTILTLLFTLFLSAGAVAQNLDAARARQFEEAILRGEEFLNAKEYAKAKAEYQKALSIDPSAKYPKDKLAQIQKVYTDPEDEARFAAAIESGNRLMQAKKFEEARDQFSIALNIKPDDKPTRDKLNEAEKSAAARQEMLKQYAKLIADADQLYAAEKLAEAKELYANAAALNPDEKHPANRVREIETKLAKDKAQQDSYDKLLAEADDAYMERDFATAKAKYEQASKVKPAENYPKSMIARVEESLSQMKDAKENYQKTINSADKLFQSGDYETALTAYQNASKILPDEKYPATQIGKINDILKQRQQLDENYGKAIASGDDLFLKGKYEEARTAYQQALALKPAESYPKQRTGEIDGILAEAKAAEILKNYNNKIAEADALFREKDYGKALAAYREAQKIKADEKYPDQQISAINRILAEEQAATDAFNAAIASADQQFEAKNYAEAREQYNRALEINSKAPYPASQIARIDKLIAGQKEIDENYRKALKEADRFYSDNNYGKAETEYNRASALKPEEAYPKEQLQKIRETIEKQRSADESYAALIAEGDRYFQENDLENAASAYNNALSIKPGEKYPSGRIAEIGKAMENQRIQRGKYDTETAAADKLFEGGKYAEARKGYLKAQEIMPAESYPAQQIAKIDNITKEREALEENYSRHISNADAAFSNKNYEAAKQSYQQALLLKPNEKYPSERIAMAEKQIEAENSMLDSYRKTIAEADALFSASDLKGAQARYSEALKLKPGEAYPAQQIELINRTIADQKANEKAFAKAIEEADRFFVVKDYRQAQTRYNEALSLKPGDTHAGSRVQEIARILGEQEELEQQYATAIELGDAKFSEGLLDEAEAAYRQALKLKPSEAYPDKQIGLITRKRDEAKLLTEKYAGAIAKADAALEAGDYTNALAGYQEALGYKPGSEYPAGRVREINDIIQEQKMLADKSYYDAIQQADQLYSEKDYTSAMKYYETAQSLKPAEKYPIDRILAIRTIFQERAMNQMAAYNKLIINADRLYQDKIFDQAIDAYLEASLAKPDETYPADMIRKIRKYLEDHAMVDLINQTTAIEMDTEKKITFTPIEMRLRKNNYISLKARKTSESDPKVFVNYGKGSQKNGGIVLRSITTDETADYLIRISIQDKWYREDNNWIAIYAEGGSVEITRMQIAQGD